MGDSEKDLSFNVVFNINIVVKLMVSVDGN